MWTYSNEKKVVLQSFITLTINQLQNCCRLNIDFDCELKKGKNLDVIIFASTPFICLDFYDCHCFSDWRTEKSHTSIHFKFLAAFSS